MTTAPAVSASDAIARFADEIIQGHREAFAALRQILSTAITAATAKPDSSSPPALPPAQARTLAIALRAAMALLRKQPPISEDDEEDAKPHRNPPRPLTRDDVLSIAASQRAGKKYLPFDVVPRLKAWQEYADHMGFPTPFDFPKDLLATFPGRAERAPEPEQAQQPTPA